jgi:hypothetical protein
MIKATFCLFILLISFVSTAQVNFKSSNLPIVVIDTHGGTIVDEPKIDADMGIINNGTGAVNHVTDSFNDFNGKIGIELRGSSSQSFPKKQFGIEIRNSAGASIDASLLGLPAKDDWVLFAAYDDKTLMRDALSYYLGRAQGRYASRARYCEVVINGAYQGVYVLLEKIKRDKNRVNISKLTTTDISGDNVTGGYIIKIDKTSGTGGAGWYSAVAPIGRSGNQSIYFQYEYPKETDITTEQKNYIKQYVDAFESALLSDNFRDPAQGYAKYIDVNSFIDFLIMMEVTKNPDGYRLSTFLYKDKDSKGGKLAMGPIWDFNEGFGNVDYCTQGNPEGFAINFNTICNGDYWLIPFWWNRLFKDEAFNKKISDRWTQLRNTTFKTETLLHQVDSISSLLSADSAQQRNFIKWPILGTYVWPNYYVGNSYAQEISWLKNWITQRMNWLDANLRSVSTAVEKQASLPGITAYPNPFSSSITIEYAIEKPQEIQFEILTLAGERLDHFAQTHGEAGNYQWNYSLQAPAGCYILKSQSGNRVTYTKLLKY